MLQSYRQRFLKPEEGAEPRMRKWCEREREREQCTACGVGTVFGQAGEANLSSFENSSPQSRFIGRQRLNQTHADHWMCLVEMRWSVAYE